MIEVKKGNILATDAEALVNTVNCVGIMGRGIALQFKKTFPDMFNKYQSACALGEITVGKVQVYETHWPKNPKYLINFPTKKHWKEKSRMEYIETGLVSLVRELRERGIRSVAVPPLGCGSGGLEWKKVRPVIEMVLNELPEVTVFLFEPDETAPLESLVKPTKIPSLTPGRSVLLCLMRKYLAAVMDPFVTLLEVHKLMYFMQEAGEPLRLEYKKALYGPYAENLRHVLNAINGHFIKGYEDAVDKPGKHIEIIPDMLEKASEYLEQTVDTKKRFNRVVDLIGGFESSYGMELLSTVHWVAKNEGAATPEAAIRKTYDWNDRKRMFPEEHIRVAWDVLKQKAWI